MVPYLFIDKKLINGICQILLKREGVQKDK